MRKLLIAIPVALFAALPGEAFATGGVGGAGSAEGGGSATVHNSGQVGLPKDATKNCPAGQHMSADTKKCEAGRGVWKAPAGIDAPATAKPTPEKPK